MLKRETPPTAVHPLTDLEPPQKTNTGLLLFRVIRVHLFLPLDNAHPRAQSGKLRCLLQRQVEHLTVVIEGLCFRAKASSECQNFFE